MIQLLGIHLNDPSEGEAGSFPFAVPSIASLREEGLRFTSPVTFFVGENGSGKSTLLEGIACATNAIAAGSANLETDPTLAAGRALAGTIRPVWKQRTHRGFFLRAEDFFGYANRMENMAADLKAELDAIAADPNLSPVAKGYASMAFGGEFGAIRQDYGDGLDARSHGEAFLDFFSRRVVPGGLYLLDEPETPLSPMRQLVLLSLLNRMVDLDCQFVIATHSPILMALPDAVIYGFDGGQIAQIPFDRVEHVAVTKTFLNDPAAYLRHL